MEGNEEGGKKQGWEDGLRDRVGGRDEGGLGEGAGGGGVEGRS